MHNKPGSRGSVFFSFFFSVRKMTSYPSYKSCSSLGLVTKEEEPFVPYASPSLSFDFSRFSSWDWQMEELPTEEGLIDATPLMEIYPSDPYCASLDFQESPNVIQDDLFCNDENGYGIWNELGPLFPSDHRALLSPNDGYGLRNQMKHERTGEEKKISDSSISKALTREMISRYFYIPITQAARELNVGLTFLKKRCRELGIKRWPHRKLMSLQTLIKHLQELYNVKGDESSEANLREAIDILEREKKLLEEIPDMQLKHDTKRLRQACFKANYKKRKLMCLMDRPSSISYSSSHATLDALAIACKSGNEDEDLQFLLCDPFSSNNTML